MENLSMLTKKRRCFLEQLYNVINNQFRKQKEELESKTTQEIIKELENNSEYIQRIFINAPWGMGKTYFAKAFAEKIENENNSGKEKIDLITINAWETDYFSDPMKSIIGEINSFSRLNSETATKAEELLKNGGMLFVKFVFNKVLKYIGVDEEKRKNIETLIGNLTEFNFSELEEYKKYKELVDSFKETLITEEKTLKVIIIDELDRCRPNYAIELLETVKHFFGVKNIIFIFLINKEQLKSIVSTLYLTEDKCTEYFEKFFDIQFSLPELDYEDFLEKEYNKYNKLETYKVEEVHGKYVSSDTDKIYEAVFLEAFKSNCDESNVSPRKFIKSFKKFNLLLSSLSLKEKEYYILMIVLILYFIREEFLVTYYNSNNEENSSYNKNSIALLYLRTFFKRENLTSFESELDEEEFKDRHNRGIEFKKEVFLKPDFYEKYYLNLKYKNGKKVDNDQSESEYKYIIKLSHEDNIDLSKNPYLKVKEGQILFDKICDDIEKYPEVFFNGICLKKYEIENLNIYGTELLEVWAKEKYNFIINSK